MKASCFTSVTTTCAVVPSVALVIAAAASSAEASDPDWVARGAYGMVAADSEFASTVGKDILVEGGNAIDAAVAVSFALAVTRPYSTGLGGGGFMMARLGGDKVIVQDFRETAPGEATRDMFVGPPPTGGPNPSEVGGLAVAVPGLVAGRAEALSAWGTMPLEKVVAPAVRLAREGFPVDADYVRVTRELAATFEKYPQLQRSCGYVWKTHLREGKLHAVGDVLKQPALANLIETIGREGSDVFYRGPVAKAIARTLADHGGILTEQDLAAYKTKLRRPIEVSVRGYDFLLMPPPSSGGVALGQMLTMLDMMPRHRDVDEERTIHYRIEAMKHAFADRARYMGDTDFAKVPVGDLLSPRHVLMKVSKVRPDRTGGVEQYGTHGLLDDAGTSHFCVVDQQGKVVVSTETINTEFGSLLAVDEWGLILNNEMDDFTARPGQTNAFGLVQSAANGIAPGKRPLSSMSPTIVMKGDRPVLMLGASGGPRIVTAVLQVALGVLEDGLPLPEAIERLRYHHQWEPNEVIFDREPPASIAAALQTRGHVISAKHKWAAVQAIHYDGTQWVGVSDPRKGGRPSGY